MNVVESISKQLPVSAAFCVIWKSAKYSYKQGAFQELIVLGSGSQPTKHIVWSLILAYHFGNEKIMINVTFLSKNSLTISESN